MVANTTDNLKTFGCVMFTSCTTILTFFPKNVGEMSQEQEMWRNNTSNGGLSIWLVITVSHFTKNNKMHHIGEKAMQETLQTKERGNTKK